MICDVFHCVYPLTVPQTGIVFDADLSGRDTDADSPEEGTVKAIRLHRYSCFQPSAVRARRSRGERNERQSEMPGCGDSLSRGRCLRVRVSRSS